MHTMNCLVAIGGDLQNKAPRMGVSVPELMLLRIIHGEAAVSDIAVTGNPRITQTEERDKLLRNYPKYQQVVTGIWRDNGGEFPRDVRKLDLSPAMFAPERTVQYDRADAMELKAEAELKKAKAPARAKKKPAPKPAPVEAPAPDPIDEDPELDDYEDAVPGDQEAAALI